LIDASFELLRGRWAEGEKIPQNCAENQQRDDVRAAHRDCGLWIADCELKEIDISGRTDISPQSEIANPQFFLPPLAVCRGHLTQEFKFIEAFASPFRHCAERIFSNMDRQTGFLAQKLVKAPQQRAAAC